MSFPWYLHAAANLYQHRKRNYRLAAATFAYTGSKMLRGYRKQQMVPRGAGPRAATPAYNSARLARLERKVSGLKPEVKRIAVVNQNQQSTASIFQTTNYSITGVLAGLSNRYELVSGDSWINKRLELNLTTGAVVDGFIRVIVYRPAKAGTTFSFSNINAVLDPDIITVYYDRTMKGSPQGNENVMLRTNLGLKNLKSTYIGTNIEKGDLYMCIMTQNNSVTNSFDVNFNWALFFADK